MFTKQKDRCFPMPIYDISDENRTRVTILGEIINDNYAHQLKTRPDLTLEDVIALDKVQKKNEITEEEANRLRELKLVAGELPDLQILGIYLKISYNEYKAMILNLIQTKGSATRAEIENLIMPTLPFDLPKEKQQRKISNITAKLAYEDGKIKNISSSTKASVWVLVN
jgi:ATP-dependent DNA helicase RecG